MIYVITNRDTTNVWSKDVHPYLHRYCKSFLYMNYLYWFDHKGRRRTWCNKDLSSRGKCSFYWSTGISHVGLSSYKRSRFLKIIITVVLFSVFSPDRTHRVPSLLCLPGKKSRFQCVYWLKPWVPIQDEIK